MQTPEYAYVGGKLIINLKLKNSSLCMWVLSDVIN